MFIHQGMPHIISKEADRAVLYRFTSLDSETQHELERVGELSHDAYRITGASLNDEGTRLAAVTYNRLWIYHSVRPISLVNLIRSEPWSMPHDFGVEPCAYQGDDLILMNEARSIFLLPDYWYKRGDSLPPQGALSALDLPSEHASGSVSAESYQKVGIPIPGKHLVLNAEGPDASLTQKIEIQRDDLWEINTVVSRGPAYGRFELLVDGNVVGSPYDSGARENTAGRLATFGKAHLEKGVREFTLRLTGEPVGTSDGIDGYLIQAADPFAQRFTVVGPFDRAAPQNIDEKLGPKGKLNLSDAYIGAGNKEVFWQTADVSATGRLDLLRAFLKAPSVTQAYALTAVFSETERDAILLVGADDQVAVWVNGTEVHRNNWRGGASPDEDAVPCRLQAGWNQVLCKIGQNGGNWALYLRFNDPDGSLRYTIAAR